MSHKTTSTVECGNQTERVETINGTGTLREHFVEHFQACAAKATEMGCDALAAEYEAMADDIATP